MIIITLFSALFISAVAAYFSIAGLIAIFPGAALAVGLMGAALELGKLVSASWIYRFWSKANIILKSYFITAIFMLSFITSIGIFGYLTRAHVEGTQGLGANTEQISLLDEQIAIERQNIDMSRKALQQMDVAVNNLVTNEKTTERALTVRNTQRKERASLTENIKESNEKINSLLKDKSVLNIGQRKLETEVGPIKYVAEMVYSKEDATGIDKSVRLLTFMLIFVFDPLAILLVIAANIQMKFEKDNSLNLNSNKITLDPDNVDKTTNMSNDWNPESWFKIVKKPK
jgi:hypothetical protein